MKDYMFPVGGGKWRGASEETPPSTDRPPSIKWAFDKSREIRLKEVMRDWSAYGGVAFTAVTSRKSRSKLYLIVGSENPDRKGPDYFHLRVDLDFEGAKDFLVPFEEMGRARSPVGFHKIDYLRFHNSWNPKDFVDRELVLTIRNLRLLSETNLPKVGPRMSDEELFGSLHANGSSALDLDYPGLKKVKAAVAEGDLGAARHELAEHLRLRERPRWFVDPRDRPTAGMPPETRRAARGVGGKYRASFRVDRSGWRKIALAKEDFEAHGKPVGWSRISGLSLSARVVGDRAGIVLYLDDIRLVGPGGSRSLGDFESEATGWQNVFRSEERTRSGRAAGKWWFLDMFPRARCEKAPADWSGYEGLELWIRAEEGAKLDVTVSADSYPPDTRYADTILTRSFYIGSFRKNVFDFGERIDWSSNAMSEGESRTIEWNAQLNRHFHFAHLVRAYWQTGDEKYARELAAQMNAWIEDNPVLLLSSGNHPYHHAWETLNTAIRLQNTWPDAISSCILSPEFTDDILVNIVKSISEQVRHLIRHPSRGNWLTAESLGVYTMGVLFPEFKDAPRWRRIGIERLYIQMNEEIYPDGLEYEVALGYNNWVLSEYVRVLRIAALNGLTDEIPPDYKDRIEKMFNYLMYDCMPDGLAFGLNDSGNPNVKKLLVEGYRYFPERSDFVYAVTSGRYGRRPPEDSTAMPYSGHYVMRSGWDADALVLHLDAGLFGHGHQHEDKLHVAVYAYGKLLLPDAGNFMYDRSRWRAYVLLTRAHNTVLVDGMDQYRRRSGELRVWPGPWDAPSPPTDTSWISTAGLDYAVGYYRHKYREYLDYQTPIENPKVLDTVRHARRILFVKPDFWIVHDTLTAADDDEHTCDVLFHINADEARVDPRTNAVTSICRDAPNLTIFPLNVGGLRAEVVKGKVDPPIQGWTNCAGRRHPEYPMCPIPTAVFSKRWRRETDVVTVLYPFRAGAESPVESIALVESEEGVVAARIILSNGAGHVYLSNPKPGEVIELGDIKTDGEVAEACARPGGDFRLLLVDGTSLTAGEASVAIRPRGSVSVTGYADGIYRAAADLAGGNGAVQCAVRIPGLASRGRIEVHRIDNDRNRTAKVDAVLARGVLEFAAEAGAAYEINRAGGKDLKRVLRE